MPENSIISLTNVTKQYGSKIALNNITLDLPKGKIIGLLGPNGSGKTTMIKILTGLITDYKGDVTIDNMSIGKETKALVSYLPDKDYYSKWMKAKDMIKIFEDFYKDFDVAKCYSMMTRMELTPTMKISSMSKGMKEKFSLCLIMSRNAKIYILDEPLGGVDPAARDLIIDTILNSYNPESTIILSTHLIDDIEKMFDSIIFIKQGSITLQGDVDTIRSEHNKSIDQLFREVFKC